MLNVTVSKHFKNGKHTGYKKYVHGKSIHLVSGTSPAHEAQAKRIAKALIVAGNNLKASGEQWSPELIESCFVAAGSRRALADAISPVVAELTPAPAGNDADVFMLYAAMETYKEAERLRDRGNKTSHSNARNNIYRIEWAKQGMADRRMDFKLEHLETWVTHFSARPITDKYEKPMSAYTASGIIRTIHHFLDFCDARRLWVPCHRWKDAFKGTSPKKLMKPFERNRHKREGFINLSLSDAPVIWHFAVGDTKLLYGLALWAGHTQNELATCLLEGEFVERNGEMYLERERNKTHVWGTWWIPPELAVLVRKRLKKTPKDRKRNPSQLAFLTRNNMPLVHFGENNNKARSDSVQQAWHATLGHAEDYGVKWISFKCLRKTIGQLVRTELGQEMASLFCAQKTDFVTSETTLGTVQDEHYSNGPTAKLERFIRETVYPVWKKMFEPVDLEERLREREAAGHMQAGQAA